MILTLLSSAYCNDILQIFLPGASFPYSDRIFPSYLVYYLAGCCAGQRYHEFLTLLEENKVFLTALTAVSAAFAFTATPIACVLWQELWAKGTHKLLRQQK